MGSQESQSSQRREETTDVTRRAVGTSSACSAPCLASSSLRTRLSSASSCVTSSRPQASVISARAPCTTTTLSQRPTSRCTTLLRLPFTIVSFACAPVRPVATVTLLHVSPALARTHQSQVHKHQAQSRLLQLPLLPSLLQPPHQLSPPNKCWAYFSACRSGVVA